MKQVFPIFLLVASSVCLVQMSVAAETIVLKSGNAQVGQPDPQIAVYGPMPRQQAYVINKAASVWADPIPGTLWVAPTQNGWSTVHNATYYYEIDFTLPAGYTNPSLTVTYRADDGAQELLLNGNPWGGFGGFYVESIGTYTTSEAAFFQEGTNVLGFPVINIYSPAGLNFYAEVSYTPEPPSLLALICGLGGLGMAWRRRR